MEKNDPHFINFKIHSQYSICEGAVKIDELAEYCKNNKIKAIGLCDSLNLMWCFRICRKNKQSWNTANYWLTDKF